LSLCVIGLAIGGAIALKTCTNEKKVQSQTSSIIDHKDDTIRYWKGKYGTEVAEKMTAIGDLQAADVLYRQDMDSMADRLNLSKAARKHVSDYTAGGRVAGGHFDFPIPPLPGRDTVHDTVCRPFEYLTDRWFWLKGEICTDSLHIDW